jgi:glycine C-acetyltransferase
MYGKVKEELTKELDAIREAGLYKNERVITSPQGVEITVEGRSGSVLNFCANNYLGLSSHPRVIKAAHDTLDTHGYGMSSVRFICGTQDLHKSLELEISRFLGTDDTILYVACFDANGGISNRSLARTPRSLVTNSIMLRSSMAFVSQRQFVTGTSTRTWRSLRNA